MHKLRKLLCKEKRLLKCLSIYLERKIDMLSKEKISELAAEAIEAVSVKVPGSTRWWLPEHFYQEFARLIIQEVAKANATLATSLKVDVIQGKEVKQ